MHKYIEDIQNTTLLNSLSKETIIENINKGKFIVSSYNKDNIIHFEGEKCNKLEIILSGKVVVERINASGDLLSISEFTNDDILGGNLLFSKTPYFPLTVSTQIPTVVLEIDRDTLINLFHNNYDLLLTYLEFISDHALILGDKIRNYINMTIRESVMTYLMYESKKQRSNHVILNITKTALAEKIGVQRTSLSRELAKMKKDGLILYDAISITIISN